MGRTYSHLSLEERRRIGKWRDAKMPIAEIADRLGRDVLTIYRDLRRNHYDDKELPELNGYYGMNAQEIYERRRAVHRKMVRYPEVKAAIEDGLNAGWSPEQIAGRMRLECHGVRVSHETIYRFAYSKDGLAEQFYRHLPEHRKRRRPRGQRRHNRTHIFDAQSLSYRPENIAKRTDFGHWEYHDLKVSRETLRKWMQDAEIWLSRKQRRTFHQPRLRREWLGELIQIDGSDHRWFEDRGPACTLLVFIDDATSTLMQLRFVTSESTFSYFEALDLYLTAHGKPVAFYSDKHSVFRVVQQGAKRVVQQGAKTDHGMTKFGRAMTELNIEILCANSSQAKGRVERANRTLQDRLVKELRLAGISDMEAANAFLPGFMARYNARFAKDPRRPDNLHKPMNIEPGRLRDVFCLRDERYVGTQLAFSFGRQRIILTENEITRGLVGKYVDSYAFPDGRLEFRWQGVLLPYSVFDKDQRVTHAAITENKHLSAVLEHIKAEQDKTPPKPRRAGKQATVYVPNCRRNTEGWNSKLARRAKEKAQNAETSITL